MPVFKIGSIALWCLAIFICSCGEADKKPEYKSVPVEKMMRSGSIINVHIEDLASTKDTICGMSLKDGIADTLRIDNKLYGFCSSGCMHKFKSMNNIP